jgi:hypothetical protein
VARLVVLPTALCLIVLAGLSVHHWHRHSRLSPQQRQSVSEIEEHGGVLGWRRGEVYCIDLSDDKIAWAGARAVQRFPNLRVLRLNRETTDADLEHLSGLQNLETLVVFSADNLTPEGLARLLDRLVNLRHLVLGGESLSDDALTTLEPALPSTLRVFDIHCRNVSSQAVTRLRNALPRCKVKNHQ